jgi:hypothetical protein
VGKCALSGGLGYLGIQWWLFEQKWMVKSMVLEIPDFPDKN